MGHHMGGVRTLIKGRGKRPMRQTVDVPLGGRIIDQHRGIALPFQRKG